MIEPIKLPKPHITCPQTVVLWSILDAVQQISEILRHSPVVKLETQNLFGDVQLHQDIICDEKVEHHLRKNPRVKGFLSEERPWFNQIVHEGSTQKDEDSYIVTYDPVDGSSIIDTNFTVGSIFSIWPYTERRLIGLKISEQKNAVLALYGPRTTVVFFNRAENKVQQLTLIENEWVMSHEHLIINPKTKVISPGNFRALNESEGYKKVLKRWIEKEYNLRYTGGLVPDVEQIFIKGQGIFTCFGSPKYPVKLRVLYEVSAVGFLIEKAEGATMTNGKISLLDYEVKSYDQKLPFAAGSREEVELLSQMF